MSVLLILTFKIYFPCLLKYILHQRFVFNLFISESALPALNKEVKQSMKVSYAEGTFKSLRIQWESFLLFCLFYQLNPFPLMLRPCACMLNF